ncbi:MAG TPA: M48 family metallopeptidase [Gemmatimonadaceae bacterium]|nr:M48 family metallopeptidase [Gemmatimonadaceae bacterium]
MSNALDLFSQQQSNRSRSNWLIFGFVLFFAWLGFGSDLILLGINRGAPADPGGHLPVLGITLTAYAVISALWAWNAGAEAILRSTGARRIEQPETEQQRLLVNVVEEMCVAAGLARPSIWIIADGDPNALATGRDERTAAIAVTQGLLDACTRDELQAVVAHELAHIKNYDTRLMTLLAAMVGAITLVSDYMHRMLFQREMTRAMGGVVQRARKKDGGILVILLLALWLLSWMLAPLISRMMALGVSRKREFLADAMSAQFTRNPMALATALEKIERAAAPTRCITRGAAHLCIADPLGRRVNLREGWLADLWGTHPPMAVRVSRLRGMAFRDQKRARQASGEMAQLV